MGLLVEAYLDSGDQKAAGHAASDLSAAAAAAGSAELDALAAGARGRVAAAAGDIESAVTELRAALATWSRLHQPFPAARSRLALGRALFDRATEAAIDYLQHASVISRSSGRPWRPTGSPPNSVPPGWRPGPARGASAF